MKVLVTGSTGFLGQALVKRLLSPEAGEPRPSEIFLLRRPGSLTTPLEGVEFVHAELCDNAKGLQDLVNRIQPNVIVHSAAVMEFYTKDREYMIKVNVDSTAALFQAFLEMSKEQQSSSSSSSFPRLPNRFIYVSSTEAMGVTKYGVEDGPLRPTYEYGRTKVIAEDEIKTLHAKYGFPKNAEFTILRPTGLYGPGDDHAVFQFVGMINSGLLCFYPGACTSGICFTHVEDCVSGIMAALENPKAANETFIISTSERKSYKFHIDAIARALGRRIYPIHVPLFLVKGIVMILSPLLNQIFGIQRVFMYHPRTVDALGEDRIYINDKARNLLGFTPKYTFVQGITEMISWYRSRGMFRKTFLSPFELVVACLIGYVLIRKLW